MTDQTLQELSKLTITTTKFEEAVLSWHESYLTVLSEKGVHVFELSHNVQCWEKKIDCIQSLISHPKSSPVTCLFSDRILNKDLKNIHMTEMIVDHALWPHNTQLLQEMSTIVDFKWSPVGANHESAIAILTNVGVVEIYAQHLFKWQCILEISTLLSQQCNINTLKPKSFAVLKNTVYMLATTAMCWAPMLNQDKSCYFITAQKNSNIILWSIEFRERKASAKIVTSFQVDLSEIHSMVWIPTTNEKFLLVCSNVVGEINVLDCEVINNDLELHKSYTIWSDKDRMIAKFLEYVEVDNNIILFCNKHRHLLVLMIDKKCNVLGHYINNINDYRITTITKSSNEIYVSTINGKMYKITRTLTDNELNMSLSSIELNGLISTQELYSIGYSPNQTMCAVCISDRKVNCRKDQLKIEIILMTKKETLDSLISSLLMNPTKLLTNFWDLIEVLRYKTLKTMEAPQVNFDQLYEMACSDVYMLKVYLILCTLINGLKKTFKIRADFYLPEESIEVVKEEILVMHADKLIHKYHKKFQEDGALDDLEKEYFIGAKKFLEYFFEKNKRHLHEVVDPNMLSIIDCNSSFICQCCDEEVTGFKCQNDHLNMFCVLTFTPIDGSSYLICKWCNLTARQELFSESPLCLFCDVNLSVVDD